jgi:hypothetical protein
MSVTPYKAKRMKKEDLLELAADLGCELKADAKRPEILAAVLAKLGSDDNPAAAPQPQPGDKKLFLTLTEPEAEPEGQPNPEGQQGGHGGERPGAGRKPGVTLEQSRIDNLPTSPNRTVSVLIKWVFKIWSIAADCNEIALDDDELKEISVDVTQCLEYHGIRIPQGLAVDGKAILDGCELIGGRMIIHNAHKARQKQKPQGTESQNPSESTPINLTMV